MQQRIIKHDLKGFLIAAIKTGIVVSAFDILWYFFATKILKVTGQSFMNTTSITLALMVWAILASLILYYIFDKVKKPVLVFRGICLAIIIASFYFAFLTTLPNGEIAPDRYPVLSMPLHLFGGLLTGLFLPKFLKGNLGAMFKQTA